MLRDEERIKTIHEEAIEWIAEKEKGINNHYIQRTKIGNFVPDVIVGDTLHEVEVVNVKPKLQTIHNKKGLWVIIPLAEVFNEINIVIRAAHGSYAVLNQIKEPVILTKDKEFIKQALTKCRTLKEKIYLLKVTFDLDNSKISNILDISIHTVENILSRLRKKGLNIPDGRSVDPLKLRERVTEILTS